jgi:hypothetical protein
MTNHQHDFVPGGPWDGCNWTTGSATPCALPADSPYHAGPDGHTVEAVVAYDQRKAARIAAEIAGVVTVADLRGRQELTDDNWQATLEGSVSDFYLNPGNAWGSLSDATGSIDLCFGPKTVAWARQNRAASGVSVRVSGYLTPQNVSPDVRWLVVEAVEPRAEA